MCNKYCKKKKKKKKAVFHLPHSEYDGSCMICILNHHAAHIYLCGDVRRTVYGQNIQNLCGQRYIPLSGTMGKIYLEFMWIEIHSIIQKISIPCKPMFSLCDKNITWAI